jgi:hypothetical protein
MLQTQIASSLSGPDNELELPNRLFTSCGDGSSTTTGLSNSSAEAAAADSPASSSEPALGTCRPQCLDPVTPILTRDLEWVRLGDLREGEELWAFDEMPKGQPRRTRLTSIGAIRWSRKPAFAVTTESGRTVVASEEHRFLSYSGGSTLAWRRLETIFRPYVPERLKQRYSSGRVFVPMASTYTPDS